MKSESETFITKNWRPITMIAFVFFIALDSIDWFFNISEQAWLLMHTVMTVYVGGRSAQHISATISKKDIK